ncbi:MAG TPA: class I tRNA ligase family protein [Phycisphaerales bacterium]|nr:class I tRNA ligase family protein [Phycisphaerales bacterium]
MSNTAQPTTTDAPRHRYDAQRANELEPRWQEAWARADAFRQPNPGEPAFDASRPKFYCLDMFPYPSGAGLHVGHPEGYTATDIICRYKRMKGFNVLHPMGWDAFGLPAEQYAIATGIHPAQTTRTAIDNFRRQLQRFGFCYDWSREFGTIDPEYYKWTQWIFLKLYDAWFDAEGDERTNAGKARPINELVTRFESGARPPRLNQDAHEFSDAEKAQSFGAWASLDAATRRRIIDSYRLAYIGETTVNWCPRLGTVLANDEVIDGKSERGGHPVLRKPLRQWMFRITAYADRLLTQLDGLDWFESTKTMQREWIGRSDGAEIDFAVDGHRPLRVFTTRPDTIFGATYMVVAPEHPLCAHVLAGLAGVDERTRTKLKDYIAWAKNKSDVERQEDAKEKTGVFTGVSAINPANGDKIPVWTADYVLMGYGTGAIMAVPAHDERDHAFAKAFNIPIQRVVKNADPAGEPGFRIDVNEGEVPGSQTPDIVQKYGSPEVYTEGRWVRQIIFRAQKHASEFARTLKHKTSIHPDKVVGFLPYVGDGVNVNSSNKEVSLDTLPTPEAKRVITEWIEKKGLGRRRVNYKLRDWTFSRQRYWGEPFPIVFDDQGNHYPVSDAALPVTLPEIADYAPIESDDPTALLAKATTWARTTAGAAGVSPEVLAPDTPVTRECNTMPGSAGSSWYFLRYCDAKNPKEFASRAASDYWMNTDLYLGGSEHAVGHLLYSRFWNNVLFDLGHAPTREPFQKLFHQGMITSFAYQRSDKTLVPVDQVEEKTEGQYIETATGQPVAQIVAKMSKSLKNVINPDDVIAEYGADTFRLYEMYMGPLDASKPWNPRDIAGCYRFLQRAWRVCVDESTGAPRVTDQQDADLERQLHRLIKKVGADIERLAFNTAIAAMIEFTNAATPAGPAQKAGGVLTRDQLERFLIVLSPFAPHFAEEVWDKLGNAFRGFACHQPWPVFDPAMLVDSEIEIPISIMGKVRTRILLPADAAKEPKTLEAAAMAHAEVQKLIAGKEVKKIIAVPGKMVNLVLG